MGSTNADDLAMSAVGRVLMEQDLGAVYGAVKNEVRALLRRDPLDTLLVTVLGGAYLFYLAEQGKNEKVKSFWDALVFVTTSMSVGYATIFAVTPGGKAVASALMSLGPAIAAKALDAPASEGDPAQESVSLQKQMLARLDALVAQKTD